MKEKNILSDLVEFITKVEQVISVQDSFSKEYVTNKELQKVVGALSKQTELFAQGMNKSKKLVEALVSKETDKLVSMLNQTTQRLTNIVNDKSMNIEVKIEAMKGEVQGYMDIINSALSGDIESIKVDLGNKLEQKDIEGLIENSNKIIIDDGSITKDKTYSSHKIEEIIETKVKKRGDVIPLGVSPVFIKDATRDIGFANILKFANSTVDVVNNEVVVTTTGGGTVGPGTINEIAYFDTATSIASLTVATYPSLTELSYVKGVTSSIQTQLNAKANVSGSLTQFVGNTAWRVFYSDSAGDITELALGADGTFLKSNGASSAPTFAIPAGSGDVTKVGTPVNNQLGVWTGDGTIEGDTALTFDTTTDTLATTLITATTVTANLVGNVTGNVSGSSGSTTGNAATVTTNANLTGPVTSVGNATAIADAALSIAKTSGLQTALDLKAPLASPTFTGTVTIPLTPSNTTDAASKGYVDSVAQGLSVKGSVLVATAAALPANTYLANVITITATGTLTVDGTVTALNDRILVKDEVAALGNGIYKVTTAGAIGVAAVLTRATDMDVSAEFPGAFVFVESGTVNAAAGFVCTNTTNPTVGTTDINFTQFSGAGQITAGAGMTKTGNTLDVVGTTNRILVKADSIDISASYVGQSSITTVGTLSAGAIPASLITAGSFGAGAYVISTSLQAATIELGHASDTTITRTGAGAIAVEGVAVLLSGGALGTPSSATLTNATGLPLTGLVSDTTTALGIGSINLGHASDTTIARVSAGVISVEGKTIVNLTDGGTFIADISVPAEIYGPGWNGSNEVPTKNDIYDKIETISGGSGLTQPQVMARAFGGC